MAEKKTDKEKKADVQKNCFSSTIRNIAEMGVTGEMADLDVIVQGKVFPCHRLILSAASSYFRAIFNSGIKESQKVTVELQDVSKETFKIIHTFIYTGNVEIENINEENVGEILRAAALYKLQSMQDECLRIIGKEIDNDNCLALFKMSRVYNCKPLLEKCRPFIMEGFNDIWKEDEFSALPLEDLESIVRDDELVLSDEEQICEAILMWIKSNTEERKQHISRLFRHVRFIKICPEFLISELYTQQLLINDDKCRKYLDEARDFHILQARQHEFSSKRFHLRNSDDYEEVILVLTEFDMERSGSFYQDGKCLWAFSLQQSRWFTLSPVPHQFNPGLDVGMVSFRTDVFITGGTDPKTSKNVLKYDLEENKFTQLPDAVLKKGRFKHMVVAVRESLYVIGGVIENTKKEGKNQCVATIEELHVHGNRWRVIGELKTAVHTATTAVVGEKVFIFGGMLENGKYHDHVQVFNVRNRETENACTIPKTMSQPFQTLNFGRKIVVFTSNGVVFDFKTDEMKFQLMHTIKPEYLPIIACSHFKGCIILLCGTPKHPNIYSKMFKMKFSTSSFKFDTITPKEVKRIPKPIHACQRGIVNKQFLCHTF